MRDIMGMMQQMKGLQAKVEAMQDDMDTTLIEGRAGGGMVSITLTAKGALKALTIDPSLMLADEKEILEDLIIAAHADARAKIEGVMAEKMKALTGGLGLPPGFKMPF